MTKALAVALITLGLPAYAQPGGSNPQAIAEGEEIYNRACTACHGKSGAAGDRGPALGAPARRYARRTDSEIFDAILKGIPGTQMPPTGLNETDARKVAAYIRGLRGTAIDAPAKGDVAHGEQLFRGKAQCGGCHMIRG